MASASEDLCFQLPAKELKGSAGVSFDMGGSVLKIAYIDQDGGETDGSDNKAMVTLRFQSFARTDLEKAMDFIKKLRIRRGSGDEVPILYTTGVGLQNWAPTIETELNVKIENMVETDCFIRAALYCLKNFPEKQLSCKLSEEALKTGKLRAGNVLKTYTQASQMPHTNPRMMRHRLDAPSIASLGPIIERAADNDLSDEPIGTQEGVFPFLLMVLGSGFLFIKVWEDGSHKVVNMNQIAGRTFLSLGSVLTEAKSYDELMELARKGNDRKLNVYLQDLLSADGKGEGDPYSGAANMDLFVYAMGKAHTKSLSDFRKEDLARATLHLVTHNLVVQTVATLLSERIEHCVFSGSFPASDLTQSIIVEEFLDLLATKGVWFDKPPPARLHIPKFGAYFGALGALLYGCNLNVGQPSI